MPSRFGEEIARPSNIQFKHIIFRNLDMMEQDFPMTDAVSFGGPGEDLSEPYQREIEGLKLTMQQGCDSIRQEVRKLRQVVLQELGNTTCRFRDSHDDTRGRDKSNVSQTWPFSIRNTA
jgi:hypothetical protein